MDDQYDSTMELIADHTLARLAVKGARFDTPRDLPDDLLRQTVRRLIDLSMDRWAVLQWFLKVSGKRISKSSFYRFAAAVEQAATEVHQDMIGGIAGPNLIDYRVAALRLCISPAIVSELVDKGQLAAVNVGGEARITQAAIRQFIADNPIKPARKRSKHSSAPARSADESPAITG